MKYVNKNIVVIISGVIIITSLMTTPTTLAETTPGEDGNRTIYAILIGGSNDPSWEPVRDFYNLLINNGANGSNVSVFLAEDGTPSSSPEIVDGRATLDNLTGAITYIASHIDEDDLFIFFIEWHGNGYLGYVPDDNNNIALHGYFGNTPEISEPGDELDYEENELELSVFCAPKGAKDGRDFHYGIGEWGVTWHPGNSTLMRLQRYKVLSHFTDIYVEVIGYVSDNDTYIERFTDYALGDFNKDGWIVTTQGEIEDWDEDGNLPYNRTTGEFDDDDWGNLDGYEDNCYHGHSGLGGINFTIFDANLDNHADIDIEPDGALEVDGTDSDNDGCIDGFDLNDDGDLDDWVTIDETMSIYRDSLTDDQFRDYMDQIEYTTKVFIINTCYSGGFVFDLSADDTIVMSGSREVCRAATGFFPRRLCEAFGTYSDEADTNDDGNVSFMEAFNHASIHPHNGCGLGMDRFQYDDNGDGISHEDPLPNGSDGDIGSSIFLWGRLFLLDAPTITGPSSGQPGVKYNYTFVTTDPEGDDVYYRIKWGDGNDSGWIGPYASGEEITVNHTWTSPGDYEIRARAKDIHNNQSSWSKGVNIVMENESPDRPTIDGPTNGEAGTPYNYTFVSTDPDDNDLYYYIEWGDDTFEEWIGPYASDEEVTLSHTWSEKGIYTIRAKAKDIYDAESDWETLEVSMPVYVNEGCAQGTQITMAVGTPGTTKNIEDIEVGEHILSYDPIYQVVTIAEVIGVYEFTEDLPKYHLIFNDNLQATPRHTLFINGTEWMEAGDAQEDVDSLLENQPGSEIVGQSVIFSIEKTTADQNTKFYDLAIRPLEGEACGYWADGYLVGGFN